MTKQQVRNKISEIGIVPVVRAASRQQALQAAAAVCAGGIPIVEITMTVPGAIDVIAQLAKIMGNDVLIGAGTVLDAEAAQRCIDAGAEFLVSPGFDLATVQFAKQQGKLIMAGALTPTEVIAAWKAGSDFVKIFPTGHVGGVQYLRALKVPLPQIPLIATGGVNQLTASDFILAGATAIGVGGEMLPKEALHFRQIDRIHELAGRFLTKVKEARALREVYY